MIEKKWQEFKKIQGIKENNYKIWSFSSKNDELLNLVLNGEKRATTSLFCFYEYEKEPLPQKDEYNIITNPQGVLKYIVKTTDVIVLPFDKITEEYAQKEGEGDKTLKYWKEEHREFFTKSLAEINLSFDDRMEVVYEEFELVYLIK